MKDVTIKKLGIAACAFITVLIALALLYWCLWLHHGRQIQVDRARPKGGIEQPQKVPDIPSSEVTGSVPESAWEKRAIPGHLGCFVKCNDVMCASALQSLPPKLLLVGYLEESGPPFYPSHASRLCELLGITSEAIDLPGPDGLLSDVYEHDTSQIQFLNLRCTSSGDIRRAHPDDRAARMRLLLQGQRCAFLRCFQAVARQCSDPEVSLLISADSSLFATYPSGAGKMRIFAQAFQEAATEFAGDDPGSLKQKLGVREVCIVPPYLMHQYAYEAFSCEEPQQSRGL
ncbi:hypothetical protein NHE_0099 [Neorickettsia helminthoeca str. Oregon]|uniref:Uncharacterized protein n=1 Tax=Neorickettsia helminthoeca str. Oregon TaxID=1286528 RepID=X5HJ38_9RICK|nr:hypothetical protein [Neorickettsia helminthoeca]AHX11069.1 hypothetical protein NHE_0099 [Neorickettsia helminthoeca str. Oregon]